MRFMRSKFWRGKRTANARGSRDVAQWAGNGKTQVTQQDRASCALDISNEQDHICGRKMDVVATGGTGNLPVRTTERRFEIR